MPKIELKNRGRGGRRRTLLAAPAAAMAVVGLAGPALAVPPVGDPPPECVVAGDLTLSPNQPSIPFGTRVGVVWETTWLSDFCTVSVMITGPGGPGVGTRGHYSVPVPLPGVNTWVMSARPKGTTAWQELDRVSIYVVPNTAPGVAADHGTPVGLS